MNSNKIWILFSKIILMTYSISEINGYSYNVKAKISYTPRKTNGNAYFGYSTTLRKGTVPMIIVGAPRETSYHIEHNDIVDPGVIYTCDINFNETNTKCEQYTFDTTGNVRYDYANGQQRCHRKDNMWLGMSMDVASESDGVAVMCAPKWINQYDPDRYLGNGICYMMNDFKNSSHDDLIPLLSSKKQGFTIESANGRTPYYYAYGQAGVSSKISEDGKEILLGAPGVYNWTGTIIRYKLEMQESQIRTSSPNIPNPYYTPELKADSYLGYSVGFGKFLSSKSTLYVAGAPRGSVCKGEVLVFDIPIEDHKELNIIAKLEGKQIGEYFGYSIAALDINGDNLTDLIIGAPTYATNSTWDLGRIYVYINQDNGNFSEQDAIICGNCSSGSRFGSVISEIGDLNEDGYKDVAIGSPYENDGEGAIYIYLGTENGLRKKYVQRISVEGMQGFGISISKGVDVDNNSCNDLAVGAFDSGNVTLFRCHPTADPILSLEAIPKSLSIEATEFMVEFSITSHQAAYVTEVTINVYSDSKNGRVLLKKPQTQEDLEFTLRLSSGQTIRHKFFYEINRKKEVDYSRPIDIQVKCKLLRNPMDNSTFCPECPVLSPTAVKDISISIPFAAGCGPDLICTPDIKVSLSTLSELPFIIGKTNILPLVIILENSVERAFLPKIDLNFPAKTPILRVPPQCNLHRNTLMCNFTSPLLADKNETIHVQFDASMLKNTDELLTFFVNATSGGEEVNSKDNTFTLDIKLVSKLKLEMAGNFGSYQYINVAPQNGTLKNTTMVHSFELINEGPTTVNFVNLTFFIPVMLLDPNTNSFMTILDVKEPTATLNLQTCICKPLIGSFYKEISYLDDSESTTTVSSVSKEQKLINERVDKMLSYLPKNIEDNLQFDVIRLNCTNSTHVKCLVVQCLGTNLRPGTSGVQISFEMKLYTSYINEIIEQEKAIMLSTYAITETKIHSIRIVKWVSTLLVNSIKTSSTPVWMYILGVLLGILLLAIMTYVFYKYGFFKRKEKDELETLKREEEDPNNETVELFK